MFETEKMLGRGSFGSVYEVRRASDGAKFALKVNVVRAFGRGGKGNHITRVPVYGAALAGMVTSPLSFY